MSLPIRSQSELYDLFIQTLQDHAPELTDVLDGSQIDALGGVFSIAGTELLRNVTVAFNKTFFDLAEGPDENNGGPDDLQTLAVDHFGEAFTRPGAINAVDVVTFSRATAAAGAITIVAGSIVKTAPDANGKAQRYSTDNTLVLAASGGSSLSGSVGVTAVVGGAASDAAMGTINVIETSLLDQSIVVTNAGNATGEDAQDSPTYRETIRNLIQAQKGATAAAIEAVAKTVPGIVTATVIETGIPVKKWDIATSMTIGDYFLIPYTVLYVADSTGNANQSLLDEVSIAIQTTRATGVNIIVAGATALTINWDAAIVLNPSGPTYSILQTDLTKIYQSMSAYINSLPVGTSFSRALANAAILAIWGPAGTNDLTSFSTVIPTADIAATATQKLIAGTMSST